MAEKMKVNQWGWLTTMSIDFPSPETIYARDPSKYGSFIELGKIGPSIGTVHFEGEAPATPEIIEAITHWARNGNPQLPNWKEEWMCLYCGTPQPLPNRNCDKCGAPRNWLIG